MFTWKIIILLLSCFLSKVHTQTDLQLVIGRAMGPLLQAVPASKSVMEKMVMPISFPKEIEPRQTFAITGGKANETTETEESKNKTDTSTASAQNLNQNKGDNVISRTGSLWDTHFGGGKDDQKEVKSDADNVDKEKKIDNTRKEESKESSKDKKEDSKGNDKFISPASVLAVNLGLGTGEKETKTIEREQTIETKKGEYDTKNNNNEKVPLISISAPPLGNLNSHGIKGSEGLEESKPGISITIGHLGSHGVKGSEGIKESKPEVATAIDHIISLGLKGSEGFVGPKPEIASVSDHITSHSVKGSEGIKESKPELATDSLFLHL